MYWGLGRYDDVITVLTRIAEQENSLGKLLLGATYLLQGNNKLAVELFERLIIEDQERSEHRLKTAARAFASLAFYRVHNLERAVECLHQALQGCLNDATLGSCVTLLAVTYFLLERGEVIKALEAYAAAEKLPLYGKSSWTYDFLGARLEQLAQSLPPDVVEAARARGAGQDMQAAALAWLDQRDSLIRL